MHSEELAGVGEGEPESDVPEGAAPPSLASISMTDPSFPARVRDVVKPSETFVDNTAVYHPEVNEVSGKGRQLRRLCRYLNHIKSMIKEGLITVQLVPSKEQRANLLTKVLLSPTGFWREAIFLQGSQPAIVRLQALAAALAVKRLPVHRSGIVVKTGLTEDEKV